jgi:hypothetical protein
MSGGKTAILDPIPLTEPMFQTIMAWPGQQLTFQQVPNAVKDSLDVSKVLESKMFEREHKAGTPVLSFGDFSKVLTEAAYLTEDAGPNTSGSLAACICSTYQSGNIDTNCFSIVPVPNPTGGTGATGGTGSEPPVPTRDDWGGLKYVNTGSYPISFDESLLSFWTKEIIITALTWWAPGGKYVVKAGSTQIKSLGIKTASRIGLTKLATKIATTASTKVATIGAEKVATKLANVSAGYFAKYGAIPIAKRAAGGLIGGTLGASALEFLSGRDTFVVTTIEGFIERNMIMGISKGLVNTIDGYVSDDDWASITQILAIIKGGWTVNEDDKAVSAWSELKRFYIESEGEDLVEDIKSVRAKMGDVEGYPNVKSLSPLSSLSDLDWDLAKAETERFVDALERNEGKLAENLAKLPQKYVQAHVEGNYVEIDEEGEGTPLNGDKAPEEKSVNKTL